MYAVTKKNVPIAIGFSLVTASHVSLGMYMVILVAKEGGKVKHLHLKSHSHLMDSPAPL